MMKEETTMRGETIAEKTSSQEQKGRAKLTQTTGLKTVGNRKKGWRNLHQSGYSLLEILVVLAIIGVLATLVGPRLFNQVDRSKVTTAKAQARSLKTSLDAMRLDLGRYPTQAEGLGLLVTPPSDQGARTLWAGPYIDGEMPLDPWGNAYRYEVPAKDSAGFDLQPRIISYGADNEPGGEGLNQDIIV